MVQISPDGTNWKEYSRQTAPVTGSTTFYFTVDLPASIMYARPLFQSNTGQTVTVEAFGQELSSIS